MGHVVVKQPDGLLAVWSSVVDDFVIVNATVDEVAGHYAERAAEQARRDWVESCARAERFGSSSRIDPDRGWESMMTLRAERGKTEDPRLFRLEDGGDGDDDDGGEEAGA